MTDETPQPATLLDLLTMLATTPTIPRLGREHRKLMLALTDAAQDIGTMSGLVVNGEVHEAHWRKSYAACGCRDGRHTWTRDSDWFGRGAWQETEADAQARVDRVHGHLVTQITAYTPLEVAR